MLYYRFAHVPGLAEMFTQTTSNEAWAPVVEVVGQLVELAQAPGGQRGPAARPGGGWLVVELLRVAHEEVDQQKDQQEWRQQQVCNRDPPARSMPDSR